MKLGNNPWLIWDVYLVPKVRQDSVPENELTQIGIAATQQYIYVTTQVNQGRFVVTPGCGVELHRWTQFPPGWRCLWQPQIQKLGLEQCFLNYFSAIHPWVYHNISFILDYIFLWFLEIFILLSLVYNFIFHLFWHMSKKHELTPNFSFTLGWTIQQFKKHWSSVRAVHKSGVHLFFVPHHPSPLTLNPKCHLFIFSSLICNILCPSSSLIWAASVIG